MKHTITTTIEIDAPVGRVWTVLASLDQYAAWNPFITSAQGTVAVGERLELRMEPPGGRPMTFTPTVTVAELGASLEWLGHLGVPGLFDGRHRFDLEATTTGTRVTHGETFSGLLVRPLRRSLDQGTADGFRAMNAALAARATV